jgi:holliday junction DNA helicase RuvA
MIGYIKGVFGGFIDGKLLVVLTNGLGYLVNVSVSSNYKDHDIVELYIYEARKEDRLDLYGFVSISQREWVDKLLKVNGVGPKMAAQIVFQIEEGDLFKAITEKDIEILKGVKGLGIKTIKKIILELAAKISVDEMDLLNIEKSKTVSDFTQTLSGLGYSRGVIVSAITDMKKDKIWDEKNLKEMVRLGLKYLGK